MRFWTTRERVTTFSVCSTLLVLLVSCGGAPKKPDQTQIEVLELRELNERFVHSLADSQAQVQRLQQEASKLREERGNAQAQAEAASKQVAEVEAAKVEADTRSAELTNAVTKAEKLRSVAQTNLKRVQNQAVANVEELADLRQNALETKERIDSLRSSNASLRKEYSRVNRELERARSEIVTKEAVIQSMTQGSASEKTLSRKLADLEKEKGALQLKYSELLEKAKAGGEVTIAAAPVPTAEPIVEEITPAASQEDLSNVAVLLKARTAGLFNGDAAWDGVDVTLAVALVGILLVGIWLVMLPFSMGKSQRFRQEISVLEQQVVELSHALDGEVEVDDADPAARSERSEPKAGGFVRRGNFSPIISNQSPEEEELDELASLDEEHGDEFEEEMTVNLGQMSADLPQPFDLVKQYQAQADAINSAHESEEVEEEEYEEVEVESPEASATDDWDDEEEDDFEDDEFANTQIIPSINDLEDIDVEASAEKPAAKKSSGDKEEFMSELKDLIGQKVDEMIQ